MNKFELAELAVEMFEVLLEQEDLIDRGVRCERCHELILPEDMDGSICKECFEDLVEQAEQETMADIVKAIVDALEELEREVQEEIELERMAKLLKLSEYVDMEPSIKISFGFPR